MLKQLIILSVLLSAACFVRAAAPARPLPALPEIPARTFTVTDYGAQAGTTNDCAGAFQAAVDAAAAAGGGTVRVPVGEYLMGPIRLKSRIRLLLDDGAVLRLLPLGQYPIGINRQPFIGGDRLEDVALEGRGMIDGQGSAWWPHYKEKGFNRPVLFGVRGSKRILVKDVTFLNAPMFNIAIGFSEDITVRGARTLAPPSHPKNPGDEASHNTDSCDVSGKRILIERCYFSTGDDNYTNSGLTEDVLIRDCAFGNGHGLSMGSGIHDYVRNFTVEHCVFKGTECGIRIKSDRGRGGAVSNVVYRNIKMIDVGMPILMYGAYNAPDPFRRLWRTDVETLKQYPAAEFTRSTPFYSNITISNLTATATDKKSRAGLVWGLPEAHVKGLRLENVKITSVRPLLFMNVDDPVCINVEIRNEKGEEMPIEKGFNE